MVVHKKHKVELEEEKIHSDAADHGIKSAEAGKEVVSEKEPFRDSLGEFKEKMNKEEQYPSSLSTKKSYMWPILLIFIIAIGLLVGIFAYKQGVFSKNEDVNVAPLDLTPTITPEPTKAVDLTEYEIEILNGSEVSGEASRQKESLEGEGFVVSSIGNADNSDYIETIIQAKDEVDEDYLEKLKSILDESFTVGEIETLSEDALVPVTVILGEKI